MKKEIYFIQRNMFCFHPFRFLAGMSMEVFRDVDLSVICFSSCKCVIYSSNACCAYFSLSSVISFDCSFFFLPLFFFFSNSKPAWMADCIAMSSICSRLSCSSAIFEWCWESLLSPEGVDELSSVSSGEEDDEEEDDEDDDGCDSESLFGGFL